MTKLQSLIQLPPYAYEKVFTITSKPTASEIRLAMPEKYGETILANPYDMSGRLLNTFSQQIDEYWIIEQSLFNDRYL